MDDRTTAEGPGRPRYQARRDQILNIAVSAFRQRGYAGTSMQDIGRALERTKGSLYYYFPDKEAILYRCHERALDHILAVARAARRESRGPAATLRQLVERHVAIMVTEFHGTALALEVGALTGRRLEEVVRRRDRYERMLRDVIAHGVRSGAFRVVDAKVVAFAILGAINWIAQWYRPAGGLDAEAIGSSFADLFLRGLESPRRTHRRTTRRERSARTPARRGRTGSRSTRAR
ncbi:MAG TPA: TetR/AcrR family transcriptional regulator [Candidatus Eisenbacteria bacterium]